MPRASLAASSAAPEWGFTYYYPLPTDYLLVKEVNGEAIGEGTVWSVENGQIITDLTPPLEILYIRKITDENKMDAAFQGALVAFLAMKWAIAITGDKEILAEAKRTYAVEISEARFTNAIESTPDVMVVDTWDNARL